MSVSPVLSWRYPASTSCRATAQVVRRVAEQQLVVGGRSRPEAADGAAGRLSAGRPSRRRNAPAAPDARRPARCSRQIGVGERALSVSLPSLHSPPVAVQVHVQPRTEAEAFVPCRSPPAKRRARASTSRSDAFGHQDHALAIGSAARTSNGALLPDRPAARSRI